MALLNYAPLLVGVIGFLPALLVILATYSKYDGGFRDETVFLFYMGGLLAGVPLGLFHGWMIPPRGNPFVFVIGIALLEQAVKTAVLNWRKWQGKSHAVFNGGAFGSGVASLLALAYANDILISAPTAPGVYDYVLALALSFAFATMGFAVGAAIGVGVHDRTPLQSMVLTGLAYMPFLLFVGSFYTNYLVAPNSAWVWLVPAFIYGGAACAYAAKKYLPLGLTTEDEKRLRRVNREKQRA